MRSEQVSRSKMRWFLLIGLVALVNVLNYGFQSGQCNDYAPVSGAVSTCSMEPALGWPGTVLLVIVSLIAIGYCINRIRRASQ